MKNTWFWLYKMSSAGGKALKDQMGLKAILHEGSTFTPSPDKTIINWGAGVMPGYLQVCRIINKPEAICRSVNKRQAFQMMAGKARTPDWTFTQSTAQKWHDEGISVVVRHTIEGYEGQGIEIIDAKAPNLAAGGILDSLRGRLTGWINGRPEGDLGVIPRALLYTKLIVGTEYRVHVVGNQVIAVHRKVNTQGKEDTLVRNTENGWVFRRVDDYPRDAGTQAIAAVQALGLDFAAVDAVCDGERAFVLETNTAPGIDEMEWTVRQYALALERLVG